MLRDPRASGPGKLHRSLSVILNGRYGPISVATVFGAAEFGLNWTELSAAMQSMGKAGFCLTSGTFEDETTASQRLSSATRAR